MVPASGTGRPDSVNASTGGEAANCVQAPLQHGSPVVGTQEAPEPRQAIPPSKLPPSPGVQQGLPQLSMQLLGLHVWNVHPASHWHWTGDPQTSNVPHPPPLQGSYATQQLPW
jgi:hypothetical protein